MFNEIKTWNWTPRAKEIWWMTKFIFNGLVLTVAFVFAEWWLRTHG